MSNRTMSIVSILYEEIGLQNHTEIPDQTMLVAGSHKILNKWEVLIPDTQDTKQTSGYIVVHSSVSTR